MDIDKQNKSKKHIPVYWKISITLAIITVVLILFTIGAVYVNENYWDIVSSLEKEVVVENTYPKTEKEWDEFKENLVKDFQKEYSYIEREHSYESHKVAAKDAIVQAITTFENANKYKETLSFQAKIPASKAEDEYHVVQCVVEGDKNNGQFIGSLTVRILDDWETEFTEDELPEHILYTESYSLVYEENLDNTRTSYLCIDDIWYTTTHDVKVGEISPQSVLTAIPEANIIIGSNADDCYAVKFTSDYLTDMHSVFTRNGIQETPMFITPAWDLTAYLYKNNKQVILATNYYKFNRFEMINKVKEYNDAFGVYMFENYDVDEVSFLIDFDDIDTSTSNYDAFEKEKAQPLTQDIFDSVLKDIVSFLEENADKGAWINE